MNKIYSRPRIKLPKIKIIGNNRSIKQKKDVEKKIKILAIIIIAIFTAKTILDAVLPIFNTLCENRAKSIATIVSNEQATIIMKEHTYDDLFSIEKDMNGNITMIKCNIIYVNEIISDVAVRIQEEINKRGRENVEIALGNFSGLKLLSGRGPGVKIRISSIGNVETDLKSEFISQGINQTLHRVYLKVECEISILTPFNNISKKITNQVLLLENVIVGNIPNTYYNLEGLENKSEALDIIE